jgi:hypothetical protein
VCSPKRPSNTEGFARTSQSSHFWDTAAPTKVAATSKQTANMGIAVCSGSRKIGRVSQKKTFWQFIRLSMWSRSFRSF